MSDKFTEIPDELWDRVQVWIPKRHRGPAGGRPRKSDRLAMEGLLFRLRTGCQWEAIPSKYGSRSTLYRRFVEWTKAGVFKMMHVEMLLLYDEERGIAWDWASLDSAIVKAQRGDLNGPNPTDRAKSGTKRHVLTDGRGVPLAVTLTGANIHDKWMVGQTLDAVAVRGRRRRRPRHLCLDKGYDFRDTEREVRRRRITPHIRRPGEQPLLGCVNGKPRRWVVERTNSWHNMFRGLRIRWEVKSEHYLAFVQFACALIAHRAATRRNGHRF